MRYFKLVTLFVFLFALLAPVLAKDCPECERINEDDNNFCNWCGARLLTGRIAFVSSRDGDREIFVMDADGRNQTQLTNNTSDDYSPAWSPDGRRIAFASWRDGDRKIFVMDADGRNQTQLTTEGGSYPDWCPVE